MKIFWIFFENFLKFFSKSVPPPEKKSRLRPSVGSLFFSCTWKKVIPPEKSDPHCMSTVNCKLQIANWIIWRNNKLQTRRNNTKSEVSSNEETRASSFGYEAWKAWRTFNWDIFLIIVKWRKGEKSFHDYQKYIPIKYAILFLHIIPSMAICNSLWTWNGDHFFQGGSLFSCTAEKSDPLLLFSNNGSHFFQGSLFFTTPDPPRSRPP